MGCDIHFHVEKRTPNGWECAEPMVSNEWAGTVWPDGEKEPDRVRSEIYGGRNYSLFAMLAGVRNGRGFAGCDIGNPVEPISPPRGLPDDVSDEVRDDADRWGIDGHSHSYLTACELLAVDWAGNTITHRGWVNAKEFDRWRKLGTPKESCGGITGPAVDHVSNEAMARLIDDLDVRTPWNRQKFDEKHGADAPDHPTHHYTNVAWVEPWSVAAGEFMASLTAIAGIAVREGLSLDDVRAVFWFDN